jgi:predicted 3-demethylubiquinone-9 3-methyltransferase (glyoxalase superfamily)
MIRPKFLSCHNSTALATRAKLLLLNKKRNIDMRKIVTFFLFNDYAKEAVEFYVLLFENAKIINTSYLTEPVAKAAGKKPGDVLTIDFELAGQTFTALNGGPMYTFSEATSLAVNCETQEEIDTLWEALSEGGKIMSCGWLTDNMA